MSTSFLRLDCRLDLCFSKNIFNDAYCLSSVVAVPATKVQGEISGGGEVKNVIEDLSDEHSEGFIVDDKVTLFLKATSNGDFSLDPHSWRNQNTERCSHSASVTREVLSVQSSSVASESKLSWAGNRINDKKSLLENEMISACRREWS